MDKKSILETLRERKLTEHGSTINGDDLRRWAGVEYPETGTKAQFDAAALEELAVVDYVRNCLLNEGKYLKSERNDYRILSPSENAGQVHSYMRSADSKLRRAIKLSKNTPADPSGGDRGSAARLMLKRESIKEKMRKERHQK